MCDKQEEDDYYRRRKWISSFTDDIFLLPSLKKSSPQQGRNQCMSKRDVQQIHTVQFILCEVKSISNDLNEIIIWLIDMKDKIVLMIKIK